MTALGACGGRAVGAEPAAPVLGLDHVVTTKGEALKAWEAIKASGKGRPLIVGDTKALENLIDLASISEETSASISAAAAKLKAPQALFRWAKEEGIEDAEVGEWPDKSPVLGDGAIETALIEDPRAPVHILIFPVADDAEIFARLRWGGWNACPPPAVHMAVLRSWRERFGAELVGLGGDTLTYRVRSRPKTRKEALAVAREAYAYCLDSVDQGYGDLSNLAAAMMADEWWAFWWD